MVKGRSRQRRVLVCVGIVGAGLGLGLGGLMIASRAELGSSPLLSEVRVIHPIPPYPPCPPEENGSAGCIAPTAFAVENPPEVRIGPYTVRMEPPEEYPFPFKEVGRPASSVPTATLWRGEEKIAEEIYAEALDPHTGLDVTGDGHPDAIVHLFTWGAHCCFRTVLYSLGPEVKRYPVGRGGECQGEFRDLDGDGVYEYLTCDDSFAYRYCSFFGSPLVRVVLKFVPGVGYVPASHDFPELYAEDLARYTARAEAALGPGPFDGLDGTPKCAVLGLVLNYLYSGQNERARGALDRYYLYPDADDFWADILAVVSRSSYYSELSL